MSNKALTNVTVLAQAQSDDGTHMGIIIAEDGSGMPALYLACEQGEGTMTKPIVSDKMLAAVVALLQSPAGRNEIAKSARQSYEAHKAEGTIPTEHRGDATAARARAARFN